VELSAGRWVIARGNVASSQLNQKLKSKSKSMLPLCLWLLLFPSRTANLSDVHVITLEQVPLQGVYPTLGIDRALAVWGWGNLGLAYAGVMREQR